MLAQHFFSKFKGNLKYKGKQLSSPKYDFEIWRRINSFQFSPTVEVNLLMYFGKI